MRKKCSPKELEVQGNVLRAVPAQELHLAAPVRETSPESASFEDLLQLRYHLELNAAKRRGQLHLPDPAFLMERRAAKPVFDERYNELSLSAVRTEQHRRRMRSRLFVQ